MPGEPISTPEISGSDATRRAGISHPTTRTINRLQVAHADLHALSIEHQLAIDEATFWACARDGVLPDRGGALGPDRESLPAGLVSVLIHTVGLSDAEVAAMSKTEAIERVNRFWARGP